MKWAEYEKHERVGFAVLDDSGLVQQCTRAFAFLLGRDKADVLSLSLACLVHPSQSGDIERRLTLLREGLVDVTMVTVNARENACNMELVLSIDPNAEFQAFRVVSFPGCTCDRDGKNAMVDELKARVEFLQETVHRFTELALKQHSSDVNIHHHQTNIGGGQNVLGKHEGDMEQKE